MGIVQPSIKYFVRGGGTDNQNVEQLIGKSVLFFMAYKRDVKSLSMDGAENKEVVRNAAQIYEEYGDFIYAVILINMGNVADAEDIFQEFFVSLLVNPVPAHVDNVKSYIYRALIHDIYDDINRNKCYTIRIVKYLELQKEHEYYDDPADIAIQTEETAKLFEVIGENLPRHEKYAVVQRHYYGNNMQDIAEDMQINKRSLSRYICTGLKKLKLYLQEDFEEYE